MGCGQGRLCSRVSARVHTTESTQDEPLLKHVFLPGNIFDQGMDCSSKARIEADRTDHSSPRAVRGTRTASDSVPHQGNPIIEPQRLRKELEGAENGARKVSMISVLDKPDLMHETNPKGAVIVNENKE